MLNAPIGLTNSDVTDTSITVSWDAVVFDGGIANYDVYRDGVNVGSPTSNTFIDSGLTADTSYAYTVTVTSVSGETSLESAPLTVTTLV